MTSIRLVAVLFGAFFVSCSTGSRDSERAADPVNVVLIMTDNHGAWTLGCYGNPDIRTPHIDRLAAEGVRFTRCYSSNAVCSPTRATYLTGLMPSQHGVHCFLPARAMQMGEGAVNTIEEFVSLPEILAEEGYACGLSGKWHLGDSIRPHEGFTFWVTQEFGGTREFYDQTVIEEGKTRKEPSYLTDFWTDRAVQFVEANRSRPFFLFLSYNGPYGLSRFQLNPARNRHAAYYADKTLPSFPREKMHPWLFNNKDYLNNVACMRRYAAELSGIDDGVGRVMETLKRLGLDRKTLVVFTADQGWGGGQHGIWGMGDHTRPLHAFDETMHVPLIVRRPGSIPGGKTSDILLSNYDLYPTVLSYVGLERRIPRDRPLPGRNYADVLRGRKIPWKNEIFYEFENSRAIRTDAWKFVERFPDGPNELYDLKADPGEKVNRVGMPPDRAVQAELHGRLNAFFDRHADPKYDLKRGGTSKPPLLTRRKPR